MASSKDLSRHIALGLGDLHACSPKMLLVGTQPQFLPQISLSLNGIE